MALQSLQESLGLPNVSGASTVQPFLCPQLWGEKEKPLWFCCLQDPTWLCSFPSLGHFRELWVRSREKPKSKLICSSW